MSTSATGQPTGKAAVHLLQGAHGLEVQSVEAKVAGGDLIHQSTNTSITFNLNGKGETPAPIPPNHSPQIDSSSHQPPEAAKQSSEQNRVVGEALTFGGFLASFKLRTPKGINEHALVNPNEFTVTLLGSNTNPSNIAPAPHKPRSKGEAYVHSMLLCGEGLACWKPEPRHPLTEERGVMPGDVGIFDVHKGFHKIFNLWDDEEAIRTTATMCAHSASYEIPAKANNIINQEERREGDTLAQGTTSKTFYEPNSNNVTVVTGFEFRYSAKHQKLEGGVLAFTSPAMRERLPPSEHLMLYQHLSRHAEVIYRHASRLQHVPEEEEGLYAVSGCMKSDSWALAGFIDPMVPPEDVLTLIKPHYNHSGTSPTGADRRYVWTNKGMADGFSGASREKSLQTHCLFVQGFKLGFSQSFRSRVRNSQPSDTSDSGSGPHDTSSPGPPPNGEDSNGNDLSPGKRGGSRFSSMFNRSKSNAGPSDTAFDLTSFPETNLSVTYHPCDSINRYLLEKTGLDFALCHDSDWIPVLKESSYASETVEAGEESLETEAEDITLADYVSIIHGVAVLIPDKHIQRTGNSDSVSQEGLPSEFPTPRPPEVVPLSEGSRNNANAMEWSSLDTGAGDNTSPPQSAPANESTSPNTNSQQPTDSSRRYWSNVANALQTVGTDPHVEDVCEECIKRDQSLSDVDVTSPGSWDRAGDAGYEYFSNADLDLEDEYRGADSGESRPQYKVLSLTEHNLELWERINPRDTVFRMRRLSDYVLFQNSLLDAEALASASSMDGAFSISELEAFGAANFNLQRPASVIGIMPTTIDDARSNIQAKSLTSPTSESPSRHHAYSKSQSCETDLFDDNTMLKQLGRPKAEPRRARTVSQSSIMGASVISVMSCRARDAIITPPGVPNWVF